MRADNNRKEDLRIWGFEDLRIWGFVIVGAESKRIFLQFHQRRVFVSVCNYTPLMIKVKLGSLSQQQHIRTATNDCSHYQLIWVLFWFIDPLLVWKCLKIEELFKVLLEGSGLVWGSRLVVLHVRTRQLLKTSDILFKWRLRLSGALWVICSFNVC